MPYFILTRIRLDQKWITAAFFDLELLNPYFPDFIEFKIFYTVFLGNTHFTLLNLFPKGATFHACIHSVAVSMVMSSILANSSDHYSSDTS